MSKFEITLEGNRHWLKIKDSLDNNHIYALTAVELKELKELLNSAEVV